MVCSRLWCADFVAVIGVVVVCSRLWYATPDDPTMRHPGVVTMEGAHYDNTKHHGDHEFPGSKHPGLAKSMLTEQNPSRHKKKHLQMTKSSQAQKKTKAGIKKTMPGITKTLPGTINTIASIQALTKTFQGITKTSSLSKYG